MAWVKFDENYDYPIPGTRNCIAYKAGSTYNVPTDVQNMALALGKAHVTKPPRKSKYAARP